ncbi:MAG: VOC family protein, partial [Desulfobacterales bacterium]
MAIQLSPLVNMGVIVRDAEEAYRMLHSIFDARKIQGPYADFLSGEQARILHVGIGDVVLRFIEPTSEESPWSSHMKQKGPGIHHLTYTVDNIDKAIETVTGQGGIDTLFTYDIDWETLIGSDYTNPGAKTIHVMDTMGSIGFHLALAESPGENTLVSPRTRYPTGEDTLVGDASTMLHIELVTGDSKKTFSFLHDVFGTEKVEIDFAKLLDSDFMGIVHVNLSNVVLQYCQPKAEQGTWYELLKKNGAYIHNLNFCVDDIAETVKKFQKESVPEIFESRLSPEGPPFYMMDTMDT